jgi:hypothetical protein
MINHLLTAFTFIAVATMLGVLISGNGLIIILALLAAAVAGSYIQLALIRLSGPSSAGATIPPAVEKPKVKAASASR